MKTEYISIKKLSEKLGISEATIRRVIAKKIHKYKFGQKIYFKMIDVEVWIEAQKEDVIMK